MEKDDNDNAAPTNSSHHTAHHDEPVFDDQEMHDQHDQHESSSPASP